MRRRAAASALKTTQSSLHCLLGFSFFCTRARPVIAVAKIKVDEMKHQIGLREEGSTRLYKCNHTQATHQGAFTLSDPHYPSQNKRSKVEGGDYDWSAKSYYVCESKTWIKHNVNSVSLNLKHDFLYAVVSKKLLCDNCTTPQKVMAPCLGYGHQTLTKHRTFFAKLSTDAHEFPRFNKKQKHGCRTVAQMRVFPANIARTPDATVEN